MRTLGEADGVAYVADDDTCQAFDTNLDGQTLCITPRTPTPQRRLLRPVAHFEVATDCGHYPELNLMMGRIEFGAGDASAKRYRPFSRDPARTLKTLYLGPEKLDGDDPGYFGAVCGHWNAQLSPELSPWIEALGSVTDVDDRMERFDFLHRHAHGWFHLMEMNLLDLMVRASARAGRHVIEIGTYQGRSSAVLAAALGDCGTDSLVFTIDPNELSDQQADVAAASVAAVGQRRRLVQIQRGASAAGPVFADGIAHLAFIDGSHEYDDVLDDFHLCHRLLAPGGILVFHDVYAPAHLGYEPPRPAPAEIVANVVLPTDEYRPLAGAHLTLALQRVDRT